MVSTSPVGVVVDVQFAALIPPLAAGESALIEQSLLRDGCRFIDAFSQLGFIVTPAPATGKRS